MQRNDFCSEKEYSVISSIFEHSSNGFMLTDETGMVVVWNQSNESITGIKKDEAIGKYIWDLLTKNISCENRKYNDEEIHAMFQQALEIGNSSFLNRTLEGKLVHIDGEEKYIQSMYFIIKTPTGFMIGGHTSDITEKKKIEIELDAYKKMLQAVLDNLPFRAWFKDENGRFRFINKKYEIDVGLPKEQIIGKDVFDLWQKQNATCYTETDEYIINEQRSIEKEELIIENGQEKWFELCKSPVYDEDGNLIGMAGMARDITKKKKGEAELIRQREFLNTLLDAIPDLVFYKNTESVYIGCNKAYAEDFMGMKKEDIIGKTDFDIFPNRSALAEKFRKQDQEIIKSKQPVSNEVVLKMGDGRQMQVETIKTPYCNEKGEVIGFIGISRDITVRKEYEKRLEHQSYHDLLTQLYNRTYFDKEIKTLDYPEYLPLTVMMGDINGLKIVNDTFGHYEGDELLIKMAKVLKEAVRETDVVFRWGGDEFIILLPHTDEQKAGEVRNQILQKCREAGREPIPLSISFGIATKHEFEQDIHDIIKQAEDKLYSKKFLESQSARSSIINSLLISLSERTTENLAHIKRMQDLASILGGILNLNDEEMEELSTLATLHDIGQIGVPEHIIMKPGKLTDDEWENMKSHCEIGYRIAKTSPELSHIANGILTHHERWNGTGYPLGLKGEEIPKLSRILAVIDAFDAMTSDRVYRKKISADDAMKELVAWSGKQFDPQVVSSFINNFDKIKDCL